MLYKMNKPSKNMNLSDVEISRMVHEQAVAEYNEEQEKARLKEASMEREALEREDYFNNYGREIQENAAKKREFLANTKASLLSECIFKLYKDSSIAPLTESDKIVARNLVNKFVLENGADELLRTFATKNVLLSEFAQITNKYYGKILEDCDKEYDDEEDEHEEKHHHYHHDHDENYEEACKDNGCLIGKARDFEIDDNTKEDFFAELQDVDTTDAANLIKERVSDAMSEFVDSNEEKKLEYEDIINTAKEKMAGATDEAYIEAYNYQAKAKINDLKLKSRKNILNCMVESLATKSFKDDKLNKKYIHEASLDMDNIVNDSILIYQMLEMINTTNMVNVDEQFMNNYVKSLA